MRNGAALVPILVLGACGFRSNAAAPVDDAPPPVDAALHDAGADAIDAGGSGFCNPEDPNLIVCYEFEGDTRDGSGHGLDATPTDVSYVPGKVGMAMQFGALSAANVARSAVFDVPALTIEAWIQPALLPLIGAQSDIIDVDNQYSFFLNSDGTLTCDLKNGPSVSTKPASRLTAGAWAHVACTYDGSTVSRIYVNGALQASKTGSGALATGGNAMAIAANSPAGSQLVGLIDQLRMMKVARNAVQICADTGQAQCP
jgi:hypothetical protein